MNRFLSVHFLEIKYPGKTAPKWAGQVERWYQLDEPSYALCELYLNLELQQFGQPAVILLASPSGSNKTDLEFVKTGALSPAKFVYTLPNIRASVLFQVMNWHGPMLCIQNDPQTIAEAISQAYKLAEKDKSVWIFGYQPVGTLAFCLRISEKGELQIQADGSESHAGQLMSDSQLVDWLRRPGLKTQVEIAGGLKLSFLSET